MLIPYNTDAPIYHFPYATIAIIVINVVMYFATATIAANDPLPTEQLIATEPNVLFLSPSESTDWLTLEYDQINPIQWITSNFMHADIMHLIGNMIFLWGFGLIIEGKLGLRGYTVLYLLIGALTCSVEQSIMFLIDAEGGSLGASAILYGLMAIAMLWAPQNEMSCLLFWRFIPRQVDMKIIIFASIYFGLQIVYFCIGGFHISSAALHLGGMLAGFPLGWLYLNRKWVDCEGWDAMTIYFSTDEKREQVRTEFRDRNKIAAVREAKDERDQQTAQIVSSLTEALQAKQLSAALAMYRKFEGDLQRGRKLPTKLLQPLISAMHAEKQWESSIPLLVLALQKLPPEKTTRLRLSLAQILIQFTEQPKQGVAVLRKLPKTLSEKQNIVRAKLVKKAKAALAEGSMEVEICDW